MTKDNVLEMVKEGLRLALLAGVAALIDYGVAEVSSLDQSNTTVFVLTVVFKMADKFIHKNDNIKAKGLLPF